MRIRTPFLPDQMYHVVHHGNAFDNIFYTEDNYSFFLQKYKQYISPIASTYAYCLMPNHFHIGLKINDLDELKVAFATHVGIKRYENTSYTPQQIEQLVALIHDDDVSSLISTQFAHFLNAYAKAINKQQNRIGSLFRDAIERDLVNDDAYFKNMIRYIHNNPVKHGFCERATDWAHSSIHAYDSLKFSHLHRDEVMGYFGGSEAFWDFHKIHDDCDIFKLFDI